MSVSVVAATNPRDTTPSQITNNKGQYLNLNFKDTFFIEAIQRHLLNNKKGNRKYHIFYKKFELNSTQINVVFVENIIFDVLIFFLVLFDSFYLEIKYFFFFEFLKILF